MKSDAKYDPGIQVSEDDCLCLHRNENLYIDRSFIASIAQQSLGDLSMPTYPDSEGTELRGVLAKNYGVNPENIYIGNGADEVLSDLLSLLRNRYDQMYVLDTCFKVYNLLAFRSNYELLELPGNTFSSGRVEVPEGWRGFAVVDSPNAITSSSLSSADLAQLSMHPGSFLIWDNVYGEFAGDEITAPLPDNVAVVRSFSKFYGLASLRIGYCIASQEIVSELMARKDIFNVNGLAQAVATAVVGQHDVFQATASKLKAGRTKLLAELKKRTFSVHEANGNFVLAGHPTCGGKFLQHELLARGIAVRHFSDPLVAERIRITVPKESDLPQLLSALDEIIQRSRAAT